MKIDNLKHDASRDKQTEVANSTKLLCGQQEASTNLVALAGELGTLVGRHLAQDSKSDKKTNDVSRRNL